MLVQYNKANIHDAYEMKFTPGINVVDDAKWAKAIKDPEIKAMIEAEVMVEMKPEGKSNSADSLEGFAEAKAVALVKDTYKYDLLEIWASSESRPKVKLALTKQLEMLKADASKVAEAKEKQKAS